MFFVLLLLMALGDVLWCRVALQQRRVWVRWPATTFGVMQFTGKAAIIFSRGGPPLDEATPRSLHSTILAWHLVLADEALAKLPDAIATPARVLLYHPSSA